MKPNAETPLGVGEEASRWLLELQNADDNVQARFSAWLRQSPRHVEEFLFATALWRKLEEFGSGHSQEVERLLAAAAAEDERCRRVVNLRLDATASAVSSSTRFWRRVRPLAMAAGLALLVVGAISIPLILKRGPTFATAAGEQRLIRLEDGSVVRLNTRSRVAVKFTESARDIRLLEGEAFFTVSPDTARPFRVASGDTVIQAIGTQFNVYRQASGTTVSVLQGAVRVTAEDSFVPSILHRQRDPEVLAKAVQLNAGEQARSGSSGVVVRQDVPDVARAIAWQEQRVIFRSDRLRDAVAEVNRYGAKPIRIDGPELEQMRISAIFDANDPESLVRFLRKLDNLAVIETPDEVVVRGP